MSESERRWKEWWSLPKEEREKIVREMFPVPWHEQLRKWLPKKRKRKGK